MSKNTSVKKTSKKEVSATKKKVVKKSVKKNIQVSDEKTLDSDEKTLDNEVVFKPNKKLYFGYGTRICFRVVLILLLFVIGTYFLLKTLYMEAGKSISYTEKSNIDYSVCLQKNDFYEVECLPKNMKYVSTLINKIQVNFDYLFQIDEEKNIDFNYSINGKLVIKDKNGKLFYEKDYELLNEKTAKTIGKVGHINEVLDINYNDFNKRASTFKNAYYFESESYLVVTFNIKKTAENVEDQFSINSNSEMYLTIPLSEKAIDVELNYVDINKKSDIISKEKLSIKNGLYIIISGLSIFMGLYLMINTMRKYHQKNDNKAYDKYIKKLLREYDRLIAESRTMISLEGKEVIKVNNFNELLDVHDNLTLPIMYYNVTSHIKCYFYVVHQNIVYLYTIKANDLEKKN